MAHEPEQQIQVGQNVYTRSRVTARLELATEKNTPVTIARAAQAVDGQLWWQDAESPDLCHVKFILDVEGANNNWDYMPRPQMVQGYKSAIFKPFDMDHVVSEQKSMVYSAKDVLPVKNTIFGVMTAAQLARSSGDLLDQDEINALDMTDIVDRQVNDRLAVVAWGSLYNFLFPKTVAEFVQEIELGQMFVSMERWIKDYDYLVWDGNKYLSVAKAASQENGVDSRWKMHQMIEGRPIYRRALDYVYGGAAGTKNPAQPLCQFVAPTVMQVAASLFESEKSEILQRLLASHCEIHERFRVSIDDEQSGLIFEHLRLTRAIAAYLGTESHA